MSPPGSPLVVLPFRASKSRSFFSCALGQQPSLCSGLGAAALGSPVWGPLRSAPSTGVPRPHPSQQPQALWHPRLSPGVTGCPGTAADRVSAAVCTSAVPLCGAWQRACWDRPPLTSEVTAALVLAPRPPVLTQPEVDGSSSPTQAVPEPDPGFPKPNSMRAVFLDLPWHFFSCFSSIHLPVRLLAQWLLSVHRSRG